MNGFLFKSGDTLLDGYTVEKPLGHGGFGEVYHAKSAAGKDVALKLIQRFLEVELRGVGHCLNLKHPHLVTIYDVRPDAEGRTWIVMEYVAGGSLSEAVEQHPDGMPVEEALRWFEPICQAVEHLHQSGIVHRDLKPGNIFDDRGTIKVGDYGLAKFITASKRSAQTQSVGTLHYMAPEVGSGRYGREVDVYAVGVILYEMLTGNVPFNGETPAEILMKHLTSRPDLDKLPAAFRGVVARMLAKNPNDRYGSLGAVLADLKVKLADAAHAEAIGEPSQYPAYESSVVSRPGASEWLEAPFAFFRDFGRDSGPPREERLHANPGALGSGGLANAARKHPVFAGVLILLALLLLFVIGGSSNGPPPPLVLLLMSAAVIAGLVLLARFVESGARPGDSQWDRQRHERGGVDSRDHGSQDAPVHHGPTEPWQPPLGTETVAYAAMRGSGDLAPWQVYGRWTYALGSLFMALCLGVGFGLLAAGTTFLLEGRDAEDSAAFFGVGVGFFCAGLILSRRLAALPGHVGLRALIPLFLGGGVGMTVAGLMIVSFGSRGDGEEAAVLLGLGSGFTTAAAIGWRLRPEIGRSSLMRLLSALLWGGGVGTFCAATAMSVVGRQSEELGVFFGVGAGFLATGLFLCRAIAARDSSPGFRLLASAFIGGGVGLLSAGIGHVMTRDDEIAGFLGAGAGFLTCGLVAWQLFTGLAPRVRPHW